MNTPAQIKDDSGRPKTVTTDETIAKSQKIVLGDRRIKVREIGQAIKMYKERVCHILNQDLYMIKLIENLSRSVATV